MANQEAFQQILDMHKLFIQLRYDYWIQYEVYTAIWWILLCAWIFAWIVWLYLVNKGRILEIFSYGITIMFITTSLDALGSSRGLWNYSIKVFPFMPHLEPIDWGILPVTYMLVYQYFSQWRKFLIAHILVAAIFSFIGEPFLVNYLEIYVPLYWKYSYSFPIYLLLAIIPRSLINALYHMEKKVKNERGAKTL